MEEGIKVARYQNNFILHFLIVYWIAQQGMDFVLTYLAPENIYNLMKLLFNIVMYATIIAGVMLALRKEILKEAFAIVIGFAILFVINILIYPENMDVIRIIVKISITTIPCYLLVRSEIESVLLIKIIAGISYFIIPLVTIIQVTGRNISINNYLNVSYALLPYLIVLIGLQYKKFHFIRLLFIVLGILIMIVYGGRMPLVILFFSFVLYEIKALGVRKNNPKNILKYILFFFVSFMFLFYVNPIKHFVLTKYMEQNTYSRTIVRILESNLFDNSGRDVIYKNSIQLIMEHPIVGNGIGADSIMIREKKLYSPNYDVNNIGGLHAHNGILEFGIEFGLILLVFSILILGKGCITAYRKLEMGNDFIFLVLLLSIGIIRTILGSPYWYNQSFWMAIAWIVTICRKQVKQ